MVEFEDVEKFWIYVVRNGEFELILVVNGEKEFFKGDLNIEEIW